MNQKRALKKSNKKPPKTDVPCPPIVESKLTNSSNTAFSKALVISQRRTVIPCVRHEVFYKGKTSMRISLTPLAFGSLLYLSHGLRTKLRIEMKMKIQYLPQLSS